MQDTMPFEKPQEPILSIHGIYKTYPGVIALNDVSLTLYRGEVHALMGENGAGKSTLIKIIAGSTAPDRGSFEINGHAFSNISPKQALGEGISVIYQELNLVPDISVAENVFLGDYLGNGMLIDKAAMEREAAKIFAELEIQIDPRAAVSTLSTAQMQFVEIAKAVRHDVKILVMDEPTSPLTNKDVDTLFRLVRRLKARGVTIIYISHRLNEIFELSDRLTVMRDGKVIGTRITAETTQNELISMMVGRELTDTYPPRSHTRGEVVMQVRGLSGSGVKDVSFDLHKGEILGFAGLIGSGRTETMRMIFGADRMERGEIRIDGQTVRIASPRQAVRQGIGFLPEDRKQQSVMLNMDIVSNIVLPSVKRMAHATVVRRSDELAVAEKYSRQLRIKTPSLNQLVRNLSGGNQQKVVVSKWLASNPRILIFDEPTRGIDVGAKYEIYQMMNRLTDMGIAIIMVSSEMEELMGMADRILVLHEGRMTGELSDPAAFTQERIMELASKAVQE